MSLVVLPTSWTTIVIVPASRSKSVMVIGMRSPCASTRSMTNCPGCAWRGDQRRVDDEELRDRGQLAFLEDDRHHVS